MNLTYLNNLMTLMKVSVSMSVTSFVTLKR